MDNELNSQSLQISNTSNKKWTDPLDDPNFNVSTYIDSFFPHEPTAELVGVVLENLKHKLKEIDIKIERLLLDNENKTKLGIHELEITQLKIKELYDQISSIKAKSIEAEANVNQITKDIKSLDYGKRNLTQTITVFRRLQMMELFIFSLTLLGRNHHLNISFFSNNIKYLSLLVGAIKNLKISLAEKDFKTASGLFQATSELMISFSGFMKIPEFSKLRDYLERLKVEGQSLINAEFKNGINNQGIIVGSLDSLKDACLVANSLDSSSTIIDNYVNNQTRGYKDIFQQNDDVSQIENVSKRYAWLRRILRTYLEEHSQIFPKDWAVELILCYKFNELTKEMVYNQLKYSENINVDDMMAALSETLTFENQLDKRFDSADKSGSFNNKYFIENGIEFNTFKGSISSSFEPYLFHYIKSIEKQFNELIEKFKSPESKDNSNNKGDELVLPSIVDLLYCYRESLAKCVTLSTGKPMYDLSIVFDKSMIKYTTTILKPKIIRISHNNTPAISDVEFACLITNTSDYCSSSMSELEEKMIEKIDESLKSKINFDPCQNTTTSTTNLAIQSIVDISISLCENIFKQLASTNWSNLSSVGDQSEYVYSLSSILEEIIPKVRSLLSSSNHYRIYCDRLAQEIISSYMTAINAPPQINEVAAEQLLLDFHKIKSTLLSLPILNLIEAPGKEESKISKKSIQSYIQIITVKLNKVESILKTLLAPINSPEVLVGQFLLLFPDGPVDTFKQILSLKGIAGLSQQRVYLDLLSDNTPKPLTQNRQSLSNESEYLETNQAENTIFTNRNDYDKPRQQSEPGVAGNPEINQPKTQLIEKSQSSRTNFSKNTPSSNWLNFTGIYSNMKKSNDATSTNTASKDSLNKLENKQTDSIMSPKPESRRISMSNRTNPFSDYDKEIGLIISPKEPSLPKRNNNGYSSASGDALNLSNKPFLNNSSIDSSRESLNFSKNRTGNPKSQGLEILDIESANLYGMSMSVSPADNSSPRNSDHIGGRSMDSPKSPILNQKPFSPILSKFSASASATKNRFNDNFKRIVSNMSMKKDAQN
ncbi:Vacuolar protein sorting-associated protein 53-like protein [Smittium culicis]|uniref:Vacuolar protein sorting-associated protein 53-like protein n=1 Tax=Smittium culicis TaxID=133412 RepID=A0A1R1WYJ8_9FUNG|nr:Vacuolar protein sorting-associated protein 53-like protein [Smittium culicis]